MPLRYIFKQLLLPPSGLLLLLLAGWVLRRRYPGLARGCFIGGLAGLWLMSLPVAVEWTARALEQEPPLVASGWAQLAERAQVIVVLGGGREMADPAWGGEQPSLLSLERLRYAARLARASDLPLLTSGGLHFGAPPSEAALLAQVLQRDYGLVVRWQEGRSRTTAENAREVARLLQAEGISRVVLVTQAWHMPRARRSFEQVGLQVLPAPFGYLGVPNGRPLGGWLPEARAFWQSSLLLNEALGQLAYRLL
ncbi:YdcF family protein [Pseudomonas sp. N040]|uniref:YdcF family protein n=1 Tax=Pseudomonas sp. N040 TaxID=2785325 RepID=UPI0018A29C04|nr:YdcF family protein [Pseudomonas sp. N040]MBF7730918.1 YdcF family protein [Pseudomonas sp. N040]MBW7014561.1 YdcF family protein [Pseudomonas sp. N040]